MDMFFIYKNIMIAIFKVDIWDIGYPEQNISQYILYSQNFAFSSMCFSRIQKKNFAEILLSNWYFHLSWAISSSSSSSVLFTQQKYMIIYNLYVVRFWREGRQRSIAYWAVHLNTKTLIHEYCKLSIYHSRILNDIENSTKRKKAKVH